MKFLSLKENLAKNFYPLILLDGNDHWVINRAIEYVKQSLDIVHTDMNIASVEACKDIEGVLIGCNTLPFFSNQKLMIVNGIDWSKHKGKEVSEQLTRYVDKSDNSCCLIIVCGEADTKNLDSCKVATRVDCNKLPEGDIVKWVVAMCRQSKCSVDVDTARMLAQYCNYDMSRISTELVKLINYNDQLIDTTMVEQLVAKDVEYAILDLGKTIASKNVSKAIDMLNSLLRQGNDARKMFTLLYNYYRRLYYIKTSTMSDMDIANALGVKPGAISYSKSMVGKYTAKQLLSAINHCYHADEKIKSFVNENDTLQLLVVQLVHL